MPIPPDIAQIQSDRKQLEDAWAATHAQWAEIDRYTNGTYDVWPPALKRHTERTNRARSIIDHASDNVLPYKPRFVRDETDKAAKSPGGVQQDDLDDVEKAANALWVDASMAESSLPAKAAGRNMVKYNYAVLETGYDESRKPIEPAAGSPDYDARMRAYEEAKSSFNPFSLSAPHPYTILLPPWERTPQVAIKRLRWYKRDLKAYLDHKRESGEDNLVLASDYDFSGDGFQMVEVTEHFTPDYHSLVAQGESEILLREENRHGLLPFVHAWGGFGDMEAKESGMNPEKMGQGLIWPVRELIRQYDQIRSAEMEIWAKTAFGPLVTSGSEVELAQRLEVERAIVGRTDVRTIGFLPSPQLPQYMSELVQRIDQAITEMTIPRPSYGQREVGVDTVGQHALMVALARNRFTETMEQLAYMTGQIMTMWFKMLITGGEAIQVRGHRLSPAMLGGHTHITAQYPQSDEAVKMQRIQQGSALVDGGKLSLKRFWTDYMMLDDTSGEQDQIDTERVMSDPILTAAKAEMIRRREGVQQMYEEQIAALTAQAQGGTQEQAPAKMQNFQPPANEAQGELRQALSAETVRPTPAGLGTERRGM